MAPKSKKKPKAKTASKTTRRKSRVKAARTSRIKAHPAASRKPAPAVTSTVRYAGKDQKVRVQMIQDILEREFPDAHCMLDFSNAFELLIATILAAQCTDAMVNQVTKSLFEKYRSPKDYLNVPDEELQQDIFKTGFYRNKAKSIKNCCRTLIEEHGGVVPATMEELISLGGVGRKTANCVLGNVFGIPGIVVDTHVLRLSRRMGFTEEKAPDKIERDLMKIVPEAAWTQLSHLLADHGRHTCSARKPLCDDCPVEHLCPKIL
jgi:endonuclease-3